MGRPSEPGALPLAMPSRAEQHSPTYRRPSQEEACSGVKVEQMLLNSDSWVATSIGSEVNKPKRRDRITKTSEVRGDNAIILSQHRNATIRWSLLLGSEKISGRLLHFLRPPNSRLHLSTTSCLKVKPEQLSETGLIWAKWERKGSFGLTLFSVFGTIPNCYIFNFKFTKLPSIG